MTFSDAVKSGFSQYTTFRGRAARSEYWFFVLFIISGLIVAAIIDHLLGTTFHVTNPVTGLPQAAPYGWVYTLVVLGMFLPNISVMVRRLHDTGRSGWWYWILFVPIIGGILLIVWFCSAGTENENEYGINPLGSGVAQTFS